MGVGSEVKGHRKKGGTFSEDGRFVGKKREEKEQYSPCLKGFCEQPPGRPTGSSRPFHWECGPSGTPHPQPQIAPKCDSGFTPQLTSPPSGGLSFTNSLVEVTSWFDLFMI